MGRYNIPELISVSEFHTGAYRPDSTVSGYGLDDRANEVRSPAEARDFSSNLCV
jgi:hypothetical protein